MQDRVNNNYEYVQGNLSKSGPDDMTWAPKLGSPVATATTCLKKSLTTNSPSILEMVTVWLSLRLIPPSLNFLHLLNKFNMKK